MGKSIVLCFDGTCNELQDAEQKTPWYKFGEPEENSVTNIFKLHLLFGGDLADGHCFPDQISLYYPGVGTYGNKAWYDGGIRTTPKGWNRKTQELGLKEIYIQLQEDNRRCPDADWFELVGGVGADDSELFRILKHTKASSPYTPEQSGEFYAFANDLDRFYSNNLGSVEVTIKRTE